MKLKIEGIHIDLWKEGNIHKGKLDIVTSDGESFRFHLNTVTIQIVNAAIYNFVRKEKEKK